MAFFFTWILIQITFTSIASITYSCSANSPCGCSLKSAVLTKIVGGEEAKTDTWNWAVSIRSRNSHICGGSLISSSLVITAAHCFNSIKTISSLSVTAGSKDLFPIHQQRSISEIFLHRNYNSSTFANDIAVIHLSAPFNMNDLALICLPTKIIGNTLNNTDVVAIGWGVLAMNDKLVSNTLRQVTLKTIANKALICQQSIRDEEVQFCAGVNGGGKGMEYQILFHLADSFDLDTCQGDSGGPLMMFFNKQWYLIGITSYGAGCAVPNYAGVYTRVSNYEQPIGCFLKNDTVCIKNIFSVRTSGAAISAWFYKNSVFIFLFFLIIHL